MITLSSIFISALILLYIGAEGLVRGASSLALRAGITPLVVGLTVVAFGTSAPEMVVSAKAAYTGQGSIALSNVVGSNIFNITVILGLSALIHPLTVKAQLIKFDTPIMIAVNLLCLLLFLDGKLGRADAALLLAGIIAYTVINVMMSRRENNTEILDAFVDGTPHVTKNLSSDLIFITGGLLLLVVGARFLVNSAIEMARICGISEALIGLTIVSAGTSLPELATSVVAAKRKQADIAIGNIVGSNIFNILAVLGVSGLVHPFGMDGVRNVDIALMISVSVLLLIIMTTKWTISRWEGATLLGIYTGYLYWLWPAP